MRSTIGNMRNTRFVAVLLATFVVLLITGCANDIQVENAQWVEPGWMAQVRLESEEHDIAFLACLNDHGIPGQIVPGPMAPTFFTEEERPPGLDELAETAFAYCGSNIADPTFWDWPLDGAAYQRLLEWRQCAIHHGHQLPDPPSQEVWIEDFGSWQAAIQLFFSLTSEETWSLHEACPQQSWGGVVIFGLD